MGCVVAWNQRAGAEAGAGAGAIAKMSLCVCLCGPKVFFQCDGEGEGWGNVATAIARCVCCLFPFAPVLFQY